MFDGGDDLYENRKSVNAYGCLRKSFLLASFFFFAKEEGRSKLHSEDDADDGGNKYETNGMKLFEYCLNNV